MNHPSRTSAEQPTTLADWERSDDYHNERLIKSDPLLDNISTEAAKQGVPLISVSKAQGKFMNLLLKSMQAKKVLEVGTLAGFSGIWMARALPDDGQLVTLEYSDLHAKVAEANFAAAKLTHKVKIIVGKAADTLPTITEDGTFDLAFIDADKTGNLDYYIHAKRLVRSGGVIIVDNVVRNGFVAVPEVTDTAIEGVRRLLEYVKTDTEVEATTLATVGEKGYDGFLYGVKL
ncbi:hypothetical protein FRB94_006583 [Tulasnella sp. JGI-2019a]|nr:hypothetical protein FRB93_012076 [Tulasnella sp. JGI-2019a]KAG9012215.1 hypothetical protein FRB94_006583 [Tulasnella sp. JGI-2019a]